MTEQSTDIRRRQLRFRAWHRGTREADLLMGPFADDFLGQCPDSEVEAFAHLCTAEDPDIWDWVVGRKPVDPAHDGTVFQALLAFVRARAV